MNYRILIVEDEPIIANDLKQILLDLDYVVVGIAYNMEKACAYLDSTNLDLVLIDIHLKGSRSGIDLADWINKHHKLPFIFITSFADKLTLTKAKATLPAAYIVKPFTEKDIFTSIELAYFKTSKSNSALSYDAVNAKSLEKITQREYEILMDLIEGLSGPQISSKYHISINTLKSHTKKIYLKFGVHNRGQVVSTVLK